MMIVMGLRAFLWCEAEGVVEKKRERKDNVQ